MDIHMGINVGRMFTDQAVNIPGEGFSDLPEIGRQIRPGAYDIHLDCPNRDRFLSRLKQTLDQRHGVKPIDYCKFSKLPFAWSRYVPPCVDSTY